MHLLAWEGGPWAFAQELDASYHFSSRYVNPMDKLPNLAGNWVFWLLLIIQVVEVGIDVAPAEADDCWLHPKRRRRERTPCILAEATAIARGRDCAWFPS